jgi:hypothetical protein
VRHLHRAPPVIGRGGEAPPPVEGEEEGGDCDVGAESKFSTKIKGVALELKFLSSAMVWLFVSVCQVVGSILNSRTNFFIVNQ